MSGVIITVAGLEWPKEGKKQGKVIDSTGKKWNVWANQVDSFKQFQSYEVTFKTNNFNGQTYYIIETAKPVGGMQAAQAALHPPAFTPSPYPAGSKPQPYSEDQRRMDIFVSVLINNSEFDPACTPEDELVDIVNMFKRVWKKAYGPKPDPISSTIKTQDMSDEIGF